MLRNTVQSSMKGHKEDEEESLSEVMSALDGALDIVGIWTAF